MARRSAVGAALPGLAMISGAVMSSASLEVRVTAEIPRLLDILSSRLNSDPYAAIREYISNAYDASRQYPASSIWVGCDDHSIIIDDRGCGMTREVICTAFSRIGGRYDAGQKGSVGEFGLGVL